MSIMSLCNEVTCEHLPKDIARLIAEYTRDDDYTQAKQLIELYVDKAITLPLYEFQYCFTVVGLGFVETEQKTPHVRITLLNNFIEMESTCVCEINELIELIINETQLFSYAIVLKNLVHLIRPQLQRKIIHGIL